MRYPPRGTTRAAQATHFGWHPELDGLRAFAVIVVLGFHYLAVYGFHSQSANWLRGGFLGVDLFFVLSGFLITTLLLQEQNRTGRIAIFAFYVRRAFRLLPAATVFLALYVLIEVAFFGSPPRALLTDAAAAFAYSFNWLLVADREIGAHMGHLWSLSVEEQFYLVWPGVLALMLSRGWSHGRMVRFTGGAAAVAAVVPVVLPGAGYPTFFFNTAFRIHPALIGALCAQLYVAGALHGGSFRGRLASKLVAGSVALLLALVLLADRKAEWMYAGGFQLAALACAVVVMAVVLAPDSPAKRLLRCAPLVYLGKRSYAIYLWHWPIVRWVGATDSPWTYVLAIVLSLLAAEASWRLVERRALRLRRGARKVVAFPQAAPAAEYRRAA